MAWCRQVSNHYWDQCLPRSMSPYGVIRPQWIDWMRCRMFSRNVFKINWTNFEENMSNFPVNTVPARGLGHQKTQWWSILWSRTRSVVTSFICSFSHGWHDDVTYHGTNQRGDAGSNPWLRPDRPPPVCPMAHHDSQGRSCIGGPD